MYITTLIVPSTMDTAEMFYFFDFDLFAHFPLQIVLIPLLFAALVFMLEAPSQCPFVL